MNVEETLQKFYKAVYWIFGILLIGTISFVLYTRFNKQVAGVFVFLLGALALYYYYVKWFIVGATFVPPVTVCPDFLVNVGVANKDTAQFFCVDPNGVSAKGFRAMSPSEFQAPTEIPAGGSVSSGVVITPSKDSKPDAISAFCTALSGAGLSWINMCNTV